MTPPASAAARPAPARAPVARPRRPALARPRGRQRRSTRLGLLLIPVVAILLGGIVWVNAAELRLTKQQGDVARRQARVQQQLTALKAREERMDTEVVDRATTLGMRFPTANEVTYLDASGTRP